MKPIRSMFYVVCLTAALGGAAIAATATRPGDQGVARRA
jgi:hypothetical protein